MNHTNISGLTVVIDAGVTGNILEESLLISITVGSSRGFRMALEEGTETAVSL